MSIDITAIRDRVTARTYAWTNLPVARDDLRQDTADYRAAVLALDDALVDYEVEVAERRTRLREHHEAVADALREGKKPPVAKVPSLEEIEVRNGALIAAREALVHEAAAKAERTAAEHYAQMRADAVEQMQAAAAAVAQHTAATAQSIHDWGSAAQTLGRLDRHWAPRTAKLDGATVIHQVESWTQTASMESTQAARNAETAADKLQRLSGDAVITEFDPAGGDEQYSQRYLAEQSPATRQILTDRAAASAQGVTPLPVPTEPSATEVFLPAS